MAAIGGFEGGPQLAVAVSGGADSTALAFLSHEWTVAQGGQTTAMILDHGLRTESAGEAATTRDRLQARGISTMLLHWPGPHPSVNLQAMAREARYRILEQRCAEAGILHLLLGHHRDDQIETILQRLDRGSGVDGMAGMMPIRYQPFGRLLRPLLACPKSDLIATCQRFGAVWVEDPGNRTDRFGRSRLRGVMDRALGTPPARLAGFAEHAGRARLALEQTTATVLAQSFRLDPAGVARLRVQALRTQPQEIQLRVVAIASAAVAGADHPARFARLQRLTERLLAPDRTSRTFGGCRWLPLKDDSWMVLREPAAIEGSRLVEGETEWDGRFRISGGWPGLRVAAFDKAFQAKAKAQGWIPPTAHRLPRVAWTSLPVLYDLDGPIAAPHLTYCRSVEEAARLATVAVSFHPRQPFANASGHGSALTAFASSRKSFR